MINDRESRYGWRVSRFLNRSQHLKIFVMAALVAAVHGCLLALYWRGGTKVLWGDENRYMASARALLDGDPSWWPEPLWPPLSSHFLAGVMAVFGEGMVGVQLVQSALLGVTAIIFGDLTRRWTGSRTAGTAALMLMLTYPPLAAFAHYLWPEVLHMVLALIAIWGLAVRGGSIFWCGLAGVAFGLALLTKSLLGPFLPVILVAAFWGDHRPRRFIRFAACVGLACTTVMPVVWAQKERIGVAMIADSAAFNLWVGLNDQGKKSFENEYVAKAFIQFRDGGGSFRERNDGLRRRSLQFVRERGLAQVLKTQLSRQYFRLFDKETYLTEQLPGGSAARQEAGYIGVGRVMTRVVRWASFSGYLLLLVTAPLGFLNWEFKDRRWVRVMLVFFAYNLFLFLFLHVKSRYRIQLLPVAFLGSAAAFAWAEDRIARGWDGVSAIRLGFAGVVSAILLVLAFCGGYF